MYIFLIKDLTFLAHHLIQKQNSPAGQSGRSSNLRVVIPTPMTQGGLNSDDMSYSEVS